jgi:hypothetical protein
VWCVLPFNVAAPAPLRTPAQPVYGRLAERAH